MQYNEFISTIVNSELDDWMYDDDFGKYTFKNDIRITIVSDKDDKDTEFYEEWINKFHNKTAKRARFFLCFNGDMKIAFYTAAVDGYRMLIPYTEIGTMNITQENYKIGQILNIPYCKVIDRYDEYLKRVGMTVI